ncbi:hypothetical protein LX87_02287 [Larkinella arboricola]|uniref:Uncharacterized protein n=1 Tax=Larkinella arboricola TaxID=643671 RepID=A0A327WVL9_LARAB|nr:hypothetical protein [Larkinella arboricola]RAJ97387.1 hypothetical protein LX87_02287 [Larkinella arboricola]
MNKYVLTLLTVIVSAVFGFAQGPIFQDKAGETSIQTGDNALFLNSGDASIGFQLSKATRNVKEVKGVSVYKPQVEFGGNIKTKATEGVSSVLDNGKLKIGVDITGFYRRAFVANPKPDQNTTWFITGRYSRAQHNILQRAGLTDFDSKTFSVLQFSAGINGFASSPFLKGPNSNGDIINSTFIYGISFGIGGFSNFENLLSVEQYTMAASTTSSPQTSTVILKDKKKGVEGNYIAGDGFKLNADFYYFPQVVLQGRVGLGGNYRLFHMNDYEVSNTSVGVIVNMTKVSNQIVLGLFYQINDVFSQEGRSLKNQVNFVAGYKFQ